VTNSSSVLHCCLKWEVAAECKWGILYMAYATGAKMSGYWQADPSFCYIECLASKINKEPAAAV
jgi:hypothetical protein